MVAHLPYCSGCPVCVQGKRNNTPQKSPTRTPHVPNVSLECGFRTGATANNTLTFRGLCKAMDVVRCRGRDLQGQDQTAVRRLAGWLGELKRNQFTFKTWQEPALRALMREAVARAKVNGVKQLPDEESGIQPAIPNRPSPGECSTNAASEWVVQAIEDEARIPKLSLEHKLGLNISCHFKITHWRVGHLAMLL